MTKGRQTFLGKRHTAETIEKMREAKRRWHREVGFSAEALRRIGDSSKGRPAKRGSDNHWWKGGRTIDSRDGYVLVRKPDHPYARKDGYILEHRLIMEGIVGRHLFPDEDVNHRNGKKDDNRPENLMLVRHMKHYEEHSCPKCGFRMYTR